MRPEIGPGFPKYPSSLQWDNRHSVVVVVVLTCGCCCKKKSYFMHVLNMLLASENSLTLFEKAERT